MYSKNSFYASLGFVCVIFNQLILCALLLAFVMLRERNQWLNRQVLQSILLLILLTIIFKIFEVIILVLSPLYIVPLLGYSVISLIQGVSGIIQIIFIIISFVAVIRVGNNKEANIPLLNGLAYQLHSMAISWGIIFVDWD